VRRLGLVLIAVTAFIAVSHGTIVIAMEEQRGAVPGGVPLPDTPKAQEQEEATPSMSDTGTEIRIPGLGKIGTLPKMDFGLDLLYGAAEDNNKVSPGFASPQDLEEQRDLTIHGSVKHRF
jgi:hypothetical protein